MSEVRQKPNSVLQRLDLYEILFSRLPTLYRRQDAILHGLVALIFGAAVLIYLYNYCTNQYTTLNVPVTMLTAMPGLFMVWVIGMLCRPSWPRLGLFIISFAQVFLFIIVIVFSLASIITTPFQTIDLGLLHLDQIVGFSTLGLLKWTYTYPFLVTLLKVCYDFWFPLLCFTPLLLALLNQKNSIDQYLLATFLSFLIGGLVYYFMPTVAPAGVLSSPYFMPSQHELVQRFILVHQSLPITVSGGGMIAFPSFHVVNMLLVLYAWRRWWWASIPVAIVVAISIAATLLLGYHYLVDVLAGGLLAYVSILIANKLLK